MGKPRAVTRKRSIKDRLAGIVQGGATTGVYGTILLTLMNLHDPSLLAGSGLMPFLTSVGGNLMASILERVSRGEKVPDAELKQVLQIPEEVEALRTAVQTQGDLLRPLLSGLPVEIAALLEELSGLRKESATADKQVIDSLAAILDTLSPPPVSEEQQHRILTAYAESLLQSRYARMSSGGILAPDSRVENQIREPLLKDTFVEPYLTGAELVSASRVQVARLFEQFHDPEAHRSDRERARQQLLTMQATAFEQARRGGDALMASAVLKGKKAVVILGDPGSGKSTLLRWMLAGFATKLKEDPSTNPIPVYASVGDYAHAWRQDHAQGHKLSLETYIIRRLESEYNGLGALAASAITPSGRGLLLFLDGLDEVPRETRRAVVPFIQDFVEAHCRANTDNVRVALSSRFFGYEEAPLREPVEQVMVLPFDDGQIRTFAGRWYSWLEARLHGEYAALSMAQADALSFERAVFAKPEITALARNPLLLTMIAVLVRQGKQLPERRVELYDLTLRQLMTQWELERMAARGDTQPVEQVDYIEACEIWAPIARWMHEVGTGAVHEDDLKKQLRDRLAKLGRDDKADDWLALRGDKCCLLQERGPHLFGFLHPTFEEFLAARDVWHEEGFTPDLPRYIEDPRWHEVIRLACGYLGVLTVPRKSDKVTDMIRRVLDHGSPYESLLHRDLLLAASCIADDVKPSKDIQQEIGARLVEIVTSQSMPESRKDAMEVLIACTRIQLPPSLCAEVVSFVDKEDYAPLQLGLVRWLARRGDPDSLSHLRTMGDGSSDAGLLAAAELWRKEGSDEQLLLILKRYDASTSQAKAYLNAILRTDVQKLLSLASPSEPDTLLAVAGILRGTDYFARVRPALIELLKVDDEVVRWRSISCLGSAPTTIAAAVRLCASDSEDMRCSAARFVHSAKPQDKAAIEALVSLLNAQSGLHKAWGADALLNTEHRELGIRTLLEVMNHGDGIEAGAAAEILILIPEYREAATAKLLSLLNDPVEAVRYWAALPLSTTEQLEAAVWTLLPMLRTRYEYQRANATDLLLRVRPSSVIQAISKPLGPYIGEDKIVIEEADELYPAAWLYAMLTTRADRSQ